jgi:hypothetical protein
VSGGRERYEARAENCGALIGARSTLIVWFRRCAY